MELLIDQRLMCHAKRFDHIDNTIFYFFLSTSQVIESCIDKKFVPIASILHEVQIKGREIFYEKDIETAFDLKVSGVIHETKIYPVLSD